MVRSTYAWCPRCPACINIFRNINIYIFINIIFLVLKINKEAITNVVTNFFFVFFLIGEFDKNNDVGKNTKDASKL